MHVSAIVLAMVLWWGDVALVATVENVPFLALADLASRESTLNAEAVRWCVSWGEKGCISEAGCYHNCRARKQVWSNRLDVGFWQLRDAPSWSWMRYYAKVGKAPYNPTCALNRACAAFAMIAAIRHLKVVESRTKWRCAAKRNPRIAWIAKWNGCKSYAKAKLATEETQ